MDTTSGSLIWSFPQEGQEEDLLGIYASPVVAGDVVLVGGYNGVLYAVNPDTRQKVWEFSTGDAIVAPPALLLEAEEPEAPPGPSVAGTPTATPTPSVASMSEPVNASPGIEAILVASSDGALYSPERRRS